MGLNSNKNSFFIGLFYYGNRESSIYIYIYIYICTIISNMGIFIGGIKSFTYTS